MNIAVVHIEGQSYEIYIPYYRAIILWVTDASVKCIRNLRILQDC